MKFIPFLPNPPLVFLLEYLCSHPQEMIPLMQVNKLFHDRFNIHDYELWTMIGQIFHIHMPLKQPPSLSLSLPPHLSSSSSPHHPLVSSRLTRSQNNYKKLFYNNYQKYCQTIREKNDLIILYAKELLQKKLDQPYQLKKLIRTTFPPRGTNRSTLRRTTPAAIRREEAGAGGLEAEGEELEGFHPNWRSAVFENNSILTLAARYCHLKCMKVMVEQYHCAIDLADMGGFTSLMICAYHGFMEGVQYCIKQGADIYLEGKLRSGVALTAEHWSAVRGHFHVFHYLRSIRIRDQRRRQLAHTLTLNPIPFPPAGRGTENIDSGQSPVVGPDFPSTQGSRSIGSSSDLTMVAGHFNYDNATFDEIFFIGNQPTKENVYQLQISHFAGNASQSHTRGNSCSSGEVNGSSGSQSQSLSKNDGSFCICGRGFVGKMIACEMNTCAIEWFHFECVGLKTEPNGTWYCPACRGESFHLPDLRIFNRNSKESAEPSAPAEQLVAPLPSSTNNSSQLTPSADSYSQWNSSSGSGEGLLANSSSTAVEGGFCICGEGFIGKMIACDCSDCDIEWYHFKCVGLSKEPQGVWRCPRCIGKSCNQTWTLSPTISPMASMASKQRVRHVSSPTAPRRRKRKLSTNHETSPSPSNG